MAWFRRNRGGAEDEATASAEQAGAHDALEEVDGSDGPGGPEADDVDDEAARAARTAEQDRRARGPLDVAEVDDDLNRIDLGALRLLGREGMELRLEVEEKTQRVIAATVALQGSTLQLQAFAAPRTLGVWDDIRGEIATQVTKQGGTADEVPGVFGRELIARIPVRTADGRTGHQASRFVGVDGPRWFLRGVFGGPAAHDPAAAEALEDVLRSCVVVRGGEAMAPRDLLPLTLPAGAARPAGAAAAAGAAADAQAPADQDADRDADRAAGQDDPEADAEAGAEGEGAARRDDLAPFERGPEITETR
jgi:hypothetical protein